MDLIDRQIIAHLQDNASLSLDELAARVGSSKTPVWRRINKLREAGVIGLPSVPVDAEKIGLEACFFVLIRTNAHEADWLDKFLHALQTCPEVIEAHRLAGEIDYILKVQVPNARAYDEFYQRLIRQVKIYNVSALLSMEVLKSGGKLPIPQVTMPLPAPK